MLRLDQAAMRAARVARRGAGSSKCGPLAAAQRREQGASTTPAQALLRNVFTCRYCCAKGMCALKRHDNVRRTLPLRRRKKNSRPSTQRRAKRRAAETTVKRGLARGGSLKVEMNRAFPRLRCRQSTTRILALGDVVRAPPCCWIPVGVVSAARLEDENRVRVVPASRGDGDAGLRADRYPGCVVCPV